MVHWLFKWVQHFYAAMSPVKVLYIEMLSAPKKKEIQHIQMDFQVDGHKVLRMNSLN